ncbi:MAG TPA: cytochrome P450 [Acidimicrobiales bacterium]|nr:cytochrome P450 [Acidimicrobiales bacterium]
MTATAGSASVLERMARPLPAGLRRGLVTPVVVAFVASPRLRANPYPFYRALHRVDPVHQSPFGVWLLSRHEDVTRVLRHPAASSMEEKADLGAIHIAGLNRALSLLTLGKRRDVVDPGRDRSFFELMGQTMLFRDPPDHTRLRSLVNKAFTPQRVESLAPRVGGLMDELLEPVMADRRMELMGRLAYPLPARVICELLGVPAEDHPFIVSRAPALGVGLDPGPMRSPAAVKAANRAARDLLGYLGELIDRRRRQPGPDLLSALIEAEEGGDRLSRDELLATLGLVLVAGHETTANLIGNAICALIAHPVELARLRDDPGLDRAAVEELMRYDGPIQMSERIALEDIVLSDRVIPKGRIVILSMAAANRDPAVFEDPDRLDLNRPQPAHVGFGGGIHFCVGAALARLESRIVIPGLLRRLPGLRLAGPRPRRRPSFTVRGFSELHLAWD